MYSALRNSPRWHVMGEDPTQAQIETRAKGVMARKPRDQWPSAHTPAPTPMQQVRLAGWRPAHPREGGAIAQVEQVKSQLLQLVRTGEVTASWQEEVRALLVPGSNSGKLALSPSRCLCLGGPQWKR